MRMAIYKGAIAEVEKEHETFATIISEDGPIVVDREMLVPIRDDMMNEVKVELDAIKTKTADLINRMYRLENEYHKKMEALREMYLGARAEEMKVINRIIRNSQITCQKWND